jgi:hypothetical protein
MFYHRVSNKQSFLLALYFRSWLLRHSIACCSWQFGIGLAPSANPRWFEFAFEVWACAKLAFKFELPTCVTSPLGLASAWFCNCSLLAWEIYSASTFVVLSSMTIYTRWIYDNIYYHRHGFLQPLEIQNCLRQTNQLDYQGLFSYGTFSSA